MIEFGNNVVSTISIGSTTPQKIDFGDTQVWPDGFFYTLVWAQTEFSSGDKLFATGLNYATFVCYYKKYNSATSGLVYTEQVLATPSAAYCVANGTHLSFDKNTYGTTVVAANSAAAVHLSYNGVSTTGIVSIAANTHSDEYTFTPVVLSASGTSAAGGTLTYTGGEYSLYWHWNSGIDELRYTGETEFQLARNSEVSSLQTYVDWAAKTINIPSLSANTTYVQSYYAFESVQGGNNPYQFTVYQAKNGRTTNTTIWKVRNADNSQYFENDELYLGDPRETGISSFRLQVVSTTYQRWESGAESYSTPSVVSLSNYDIQIWDDDGAQYGQSNYDGAVTHYDTNPTYNRIDCQYGVNMETWTKVSDMYFIGTGSYSSYSAGLSVKQEGS